MDVGTLLVHGNLHQTANTGIQIGSGASSTRPANAVGYIRYNTDLARFETNNGTAWANVGLGDVSSVALTGVTNAIVVTGGPITTSGTFSLSLAGELAGIAALAATGIVERTAAGVYTAVNTLPVANGGTGATTAPAALTALGALPTAGGAMTGVLTLAADPTVALQASTKSYVDNAVATVLASDTYTASPTGALTLTAKAFSLNTSGVTTAIVTDNVVVRASGINGQLLLSGATAGAEAAWGPLNLASANSVTGALAITNGGTGAITAPAALVALGALPTAGGVMTGTLTLAADPTSALQASSKQYVDNAVANAIATDSYTAGPGIAIAAKAVSVVTSGVTVGLVANAVAVRSTATAGQTLLSSGTAGAEATWGALNLASASAVTGALAIANGGTGATTAAAARTNLVVPSIFRQSFTNASLVSNLLTVTHNLGQQFVNVMVTDNNNNVIQPDNITMTSTTVSTIDFTSYGALTGTFNVVVIG